MTLYLFGHNPDVCLGVGGFHPSRPTHTHTHTPPPPPPPPPISSSLSLARSPTVQLNSDTIYLEIPQVESQYRKTALPLQMPIKSAGHLLCFWSTGYKSLVSTIPSLDLMNLLAWLTELRKTFYLLDCLFIIEGYNSETSRWKRCTGQERAQSFHAHQVHNSPQISMCSPSQKHSIPPPLGVSRRIHYKSKID